MRLKSGIVIPVHRMVWGKLGTESLSGLLEAPQLGSVELVPDQLVGFWLLLLSFPLR